VLGIGGVLTGLGLADRRAEALLGESAGMVRFNWAQATMRGQQTAWPPAEVQMLLDDQAQQILDREGGPLSVRVLSELAAWLPTTGWVEQVQEVRRAAGGVIEVHSRWRAPMAVVRQGGRDHLVTEDGRLMRYAWPAGGSPLPAIIGADRMTPAGSVLVGSRWPDAPVLAGVELLALLHRELRDDPLLGPRGFDQVTAVDIGEHDSRQRLTIVTDRGSRIVWGRAPGDSVPDPVSTAQKLRKLEYLRRHPDYEHRIDAGQARLDLSIGPVLVDDRGAAPDNPAGG
jgi:hypothetical protein